MALAVGSVFLAVAMIIVGLFLAQDLLRDAVVRAIANETNQVACEANPVGWASQSGRFTLFPYDASGASMHPDAPVIEADLLERALRTTRPARTRSADGQLIITVAPLSGEGPCAVVRLTSDPPPSRTIWEAAGVLGLSATAGMVLAVVAAWVFVVFPLQRRIQALSEAAGGVGSEQYLPSEHGSDALGRIGQVLAESHARIVQTRTALEARNHALEEHLASIAHDLRTPLASMQLALESLSSEAEGSLQAEARRGLADVVYLSSLVDNLHQGARLRHDMSVREGVVDLVELVGRLERRFVIVGRHADVEVAANVPDHPVRVACTPALAERALANLLQNAVEHNDGQGHVAAMLSQDGDSFRLVVVDDGPGLPEAIHASLAAETFITELARRRGPGLGMVITAEIARRAGWTLTYEPGEPTGLRVTVEGPVIEGAS